VLKVVKWRVGRAGSDRLRSAGLVEYHRAVVGYELAWYCSVAVIRPVPADGDGGGSCAVVRGIEFFEAVVGAIADFQIATDSKVITVGVPSMR